MKQRRVALLRLGVILFLSLVPALSQTSRDLDTTTFVVIGEGLAAGAQNFSLSEAGQDHNFAVYAARQMKTLFPQPVFQSPGLAHAVGFRDLPLRIPATSQTTFRRQFPPTLFVFNLSVPGFRTEDALHRRPLAPLIHQDDPKQTLTNFILGYPQLIFQDDVPLWTQTEYAVAMRPTLALVELGYHEVLESAIQGDLSRLPDLEDFRADYRQIVSALRETFAEVVVMTVPNPLHTAYFNDPASSADLLRIPTSAVLGLYGLDSEDAITIPGLIEIGNQLLSREITPLPSGSYLPVSLSAEIGARVAAMNSEIRSVAAEQGAVVHDLYSLMESWARESAVVGDRQLESEYLGGLFSLNGYYPGRSGHALIANDFLALLNREYGRQFPAVELTRVIEGDPAADYRRELGERASLEDLAAFIPASRMRAVLRKETSLKRERAGSSTPGTRPSLPRREGGRP